MKADTNHVDPYDLNLARRNTVGDMLTRVAEVKGTSIAVIDGERRFDYATLERDSEAIARGIIALDGAPEQGEPVALFMPNCYEFLPAYFGLAKAARVALPVNYGLGPDDIAWILGDAEARHVIVHETLLPILRAVLAAGATLDTIIVHRISDTPLDELDLGTGHIRIVDLADLRATEISEELRLIIHSDDIVQCLYTSGTTAAPKGALATHSSVVTGIMSNVHMMQYAWGGHPCTMLLILPLFHVTALNTLAKPALAVGGTLVVQNGFNPVAALDAIEREQVTIFTGLPMMWAAMVAEYQNRPRDLNSMKTAMYAMAQMPERVLAGMDAMMPNAHKLLGSGQTEVIPATTYQQAEHRYTKQNSWGVPSPTVRTRIMGEDGTLLPPGEVGEIVYRSPQVTAGYWKRPDANAEAFRHGWFHSGDIGHMDEEGVVWFTDRVKDIIKSGGENVSSMKVERVMADGPGVIECTVIGTPHDYWGEQVTLVVVTDRLAGVNSDDRAKLAQAEELLSAELIAHGKQHLGKFEAPKRVVFVESLPKTTTGKVHKYLLRERFSG